MSDMPAYQHYTCAECGLELVVTELDKNFPDADGWVLVEDETMVELGAKPYWLCPGRIAKPNCKGLTVCIRGGK